jgi:hypothetical protein
MLASTEPPRELRNTAVISFNRLLPASLAVLAFISSVRSSSGQTTTPIPLTALTAYSWASGTVQQDPAGYPSGSALIRSTGSGWQWIAGISVSPSSNASAYNALRQAALNSGTLTINATFDPAAYTSSSLGWLGLTTNQQCSSSGWVQANVGYANTPITSPQSYTLTMPILPTSASTTTADFSDPPNFYVDPSLSQIDFGFGVNTNSATQGGLVITSMSVSAVPEPATWALLAAAVLPAVASIRRRRVEA